ICHTRARVISGSTSTRAVRSPPFTSGNSRAPTISTSPGGTTSVIIVGILPLQEQPQQLGAHHHGGTGGKTVPGEEPPAGIHADTLVLEVGVVVHEKLRHQHQHQQGDLDTPQNGQVLLAVHPVLLLLVAHGWASAP